MALSRQGYNCSLAAYNEDIAEYVSNQSPDLVIAEVTGHQPGAVSREYIQEIKIRTSLPIIALISDEILDDLDVDENVDDFISTPHNAAELALRIKRILKREVVPDDHEAIICGVLVIDLASCEVTVEGKKVELTYKEFELLKFLAGNNGRVFTREALLDKIWGMDYFGGDRTVDVHIRRLRSKIEKHGQTFIETVRNIGYRFRKDED
ncbi:MAG: response regulator transcription factor [Dehalococcoidales bacterium]|nr:MAG: response regulator transcription factor [Dehalococcoidales bacterium]